MIVMSVWVLCLYGCHVCMCCVRMTFMFVCLYVCIVLCICEFYVYDVCVCMLFFVYVCMTCMPAYFVRLSAFYVCMMFLSV